MPPPRAVVRGLPRKEARWRQLVSRRDGQSAQQWRAPAGRPRVPRPIVRSARPSPAKTASRSIRPSQPAPRITARR